MFKKMQNSQFVNLVFSKLFSLGKKSSISWQRIKKIKNKCNFYYILGVTDRTDFWENNFC